MPFTQFLNKPSTQAFEYKNVFFSLENRYMTSLSAKIAVKINVPFSIFCRIGIVAEENVDTFAAILAQGYINNEQGISWSGRVYLDPGTYLFNQVLSDQLVDVTTSVTVDPR